MRSALPRTFVRFAGVGLVNTAIDVVLFWLLHAPLGILAANFLSTSAGMAFSFVANGRHTFGASRITLRQGVLFLGTNGFTMWLLQPWLIHAAYDVATVPLMGAKVVALAGSVVANFLLYRYLVWRTGSSPRGTSGRRCEGGSSEPTTEPAITEQAGARGGRASDTSEPARTCERIETP